MSAELVQFGKYELIERIGQGGMAELWTARVTGPGGFARMLVVKRILPHLTADAGFVEMFLAEARISARLSHANIVHVYECGEVDGEYFLAMEHLSGIDLSRAIQLHHEQKRPLDPGLGAYAIREVCRALAHAHGLRDDHGKRLGVVHRDVTPSNVMLGYDGGIKLLDFGIAKALDVTSDAMTRTGTFKGKVGYISPELADGDEIDHRADQFSAGVALHEALTGRRLYKGNSDLQTLALVRKSDPQPPSARNPRVPPELDRICLRALSRNRGDRFADCGEMARALDEVVVKLGWGAQQLAELVRELAPARAPRMMTGRPVEDPTVPDSPGPITRRRRSPTESLRVRSRRRRALIAAAVGAVILGAGAFAMKPLITSHQDPIASPADALPVRAVVAPSLDAAAAPADAAVAAVDVPPSAPLDAASAIDPALPVPPARHEVKRERAKKRKPTSQPPLDPPPDLKAGAIIDPFGRGSAQTPGR